MTKTKLKLNGMEADFFFRCSLNMSTGLEKYSHQWPANLNGIRVFACMANNEFFRNNATQQKEIMRKMSTEYGNFRLRLRKVV